jgi:hypothetical protein
MKWFGKAYGAPYERDTPHAPTPVGEPCLWCEENIEAGDTGLIVGYIDTGEALTPRQVPYHYECYLRQIIGGVNHQLHLCCCPGCAGVLPPDPQGMTRREAALAAVETRATMLQGGAT